MRPSLSTPPITVRLQLWRCDFPSRQALGLQLTLRSGITSWKRKLKKRSVLSLKIKSPYRQKGTCLSGLRVYYFISSVASSIVPRQCHFLSDSDSLEGIGGGNRCPSTLHATHFMDDA